MATSSIRWQLSTSQLMKLVVFAAVASLVLIPMVELIEWGVASWVSALIFGAAAIPLAWAFLSRLLIRSGIFKEWFFNAMLAVSMAVCLSVLGYFLATQFLLRILRGGNLNFSMFPEIGLLFAIAIQCGIGLAFLLFRVVPARCPNCGVIVDPGFPTTW